MGVYINMEMPKSCRKCMISQPDGCGWICPIIERKPIVDGRVNSRHPHCPLVPVPPHYDLIDHNALKIAVMDCDAETRIDFLKHAMDCINKAPVVIPSDMPTYEAEEGE